jgi:uncharacterized protein YbaR (Trm112 family)
MKPWLLNILACPMDKHHPLKARFFSWETAEDEIRKIVSEVGWPSPNFKKNYEHIAKQLIDGVISESALKNIEDVSGSKYTAELLNAAVDSFVRFNLEHKKFEKDLLKERLKDIDTLYRFLNLIEVNTGLLMCPKCGRWYPIGCSVETVPEMLPDELREEKRDLEWLVKWRDLVPKQVLKDGKPYNLKGLKNARAQDFL